MEHYICKGGCNGVSETPGTCQTDGCSKHKEQLETCNCTDGLHNKDQSSEGESSDTAAA